MNNELSKIVSFILRHDPWAYGLSLDDDGWIDVRVLLLAIQSRHSEWRNITIKDFIQEFGSDLNDRHAVKHKKIRANYGHSFKNRVEKIPSIPPNILFHGTNDEALVRIDLNGLKSMKRQYVHLSFDRKLSFDVAKRRTVEPIIIEINARQAFDDGIKFHQESGLWLSDDIPRKYLNW